MNRITSGMFLYARRVKGYTQIEMANELQVTQSAISKIEKRKIRPGHLLINRLCKLMHTSLQGLIDDSKQIQ